MPAFGSRRSTVTVHDLQPLHRPESFSAVKRRFLAFSLPRSVRKAELVIAVSEWVRRTIVETLAVPPERTAAVSAPCDPIDRALLVTPERVAALKEWFQFLKKRSYTEKNLGVHIRLRKSPTVPGLGQWKLPTCAYASGQ